MKKIIVGLILVLNVVSFGASEKAVSRYQKAIKGYIELLNENIIIAKSMDNDLLVLNLEMQVEQLGAEITPEANKILRSDAINDITLNGITMEMLQFISKVEMEMGKY